MGCLGILKLIYQFVNQFCEWFCWKTDRHKPAVGLNKDTWSVVMGTVDYMVVFDSTGVQPGTAKWIHRGMANDKPGALW